MDTRTDQIKGSIFGLAVGDALGLPVEFKSRDYLTKHPVKDMIGYGTYNKPPGTWSDDTSLTLCLLDSLNDSLSENEDISYGNIMNKFLSWYEDHEYTATGISFDIGYTTANALQNYADGEFPLHCGPSGERNISNGSLMRIIPLASYLYFKENNLNFEIIHNISKITHGHPICLIACGIYISIAFKILEGHTIQASVINGFYEANEYYLNSEYSEYWNVFDKIINPEEIDNFPLNAPPKSGGYVVDSLESALWCLMNSNNSYKDCVLQAVNLGDDTDTTAAIAGGLAGLYYGYNQIPKKWIETLQRTEFIDELTNTFIKSI